MQVDQLLKKNFWAVLLAMLAVIAFLNAEGITQLVGASLGPDEKQLALAPPLAKASLPQPGAAPFHTTSSDPIFARNPFDSETGPLNAKPLDLADEPAQAAQGPDLSDPMNAPQCEGVKVLSSPRRAIRTGRSRRSRPAPTRSRCSVAAAGTSAARSSSTSAGTALAHAPVAGSVARRASSRRRRWPTRRSRSRRTRRLPPQAARASTRPSPRASRR